MYATLMVVDITMRYHFVKYVEHDAVHIVGLHQHGQDEFNLFIDLLAV